MRSLILLLTFCCVHAGVASAAPDDRPNILVILADDLGYSDLSCYGGEIPTPNLDALAAGGLRFTQMYNSARCCPSRAALLTGLHPHQAGIGSFVTAQPDPERGPAYLGHLADTCVTFAEVLRGAGYATYMVGKWHVGQPGPTERGFDEFYGFTRGYSQDQWSPDAYERLPAGRTPEISTAPGGFYATDVFTEYALEFLRQARAAKAAGASGAERGRKPWLLYLAHSSPHFPLQAPAEDVERFVGRYRRGWDVLRRERFARQQEIGLATDAWTLSPRSVVPLNDAKKDAGYGGGPNPAWDDLPQDRREDLARRFAIFAAMVSHVDAGVGRIVDFLRATDQLDNTLVLFLSDNGACYEWGPYGFDRPNQVVPEEPLAGEALAGMGGPGTWHSYGSAWANLSNTPLRMYKHFDHEGGIGTPMIAHWPRGISDPDRWVRTPAAIFDILPTLAELAGAEYPRRFNGHEITPPEGVSLLPLFRDGDLGPRQLAFEHQGARALRDGRWKIVWSKFQNAPSRWELYDLSTDRCETRDLSAEQPERVRTMGDAWLAWARRVKVYPFYKEE